MQKTIVTTGKTTLTDALEFAHAEDPQPAANEAVVAVEAFSVNRGEALSITGAYGPPIEPGRRFGQDIAGRVVTAAADGTGPAVGTRVVAHPEGAGWSERVAVPTDKLAALPDAIDATTAAALPLAGLTALRLLRAAGGVADRRALLTGASGGVGHYLTELLAGAGAEVVAVTSSPERGARLKELGATTTVARAADAEGTYDLIFESVGGTEFSAALSKAAPGATVLWYGQASLQPVTLDFFETMVTTPFTIKHFPHWISDTTDGQDLATLVRLTAERRLHPEIGLLADWSETARVLDDVYQRRVRGNAVLTVR